MSKQLLDTAAKHPFSLSSLADRAWNRVSEAAIRTGWTPITRLAESAVIALMKNITSGHVRVLTYSNIYVFPSGLNPNRRPAESGSGRKAELRVVNDVYWIRLCVMGDLGFAEAYMYGDVECDDLVSLFHIFLDNRQNLANLDSTASYLFTLPQKLTSYRFLNTIGNSRSNISAHYDLSNDMFAGFLSTDMTYSCAIFKDLDGDLKKGKSTAEWSGGKGLKRLNSSQSAASQPDMADTPSKSEDPDSDELYEAQIRKLDHVIKKAKIKPGHRVLEIGSGWGSMAIRICQSVPDTRVDTLTLSVQQQKLAQERIAAAGFEDRISVHLMDYRAMPAHWKGAFDRFISIEMIEAVGAEFIVTYWQHVDWALKEKDAVGVVQVITIPEARKGVTHLTPIFIQFCQDLKGILEKLISLENGVCPNASQCFQKLTSTSVFPGGFLPTLTLLLESLKEGTKGGLTVDSVSNIGPHYARTLREWRRRFLDRFESAVVPSLQAEYPEVMAGPRGQEEIDVFMRKWIYYFCYCEVGFATRTLGDHIISFTREGCVDYGCDTYE